MPASLDTLPPDANDLAVGVRVMRMCREILSDYDGGVLSKDDAFKRLGNLEKDAYARFKNLEEDGGVTFAVATARERIETRG